MQQSLAQNQIGQSPQMVQQSSIAQQQAQQQMAQSQITQQQMAQSQITQQQIAQSQLAQQQQQQQIAQSQSIAQQQQLAQSQIAQQQLAQQQIAQSQITQQQIAQSQMVQQQMAQSQMVPQQIGQPQMVQQQITQPQMLQQQLAQQQINQQINQQISQQQLQQMMYCPTVRLVYDAPMQIMQSGDQLQQQNQNIFVNQPPWTRPVQNQVIYVQQIGSNLVPVQHIDPNMFLQQNIPMYQQVVQNVPQLVQNLPQTVQTLPQGQIRQIINNIPAGMVPNFGTNVQRIQDPNLGQMVQNFGLVQANNDVTMNNTSIANEVDRQTVTNQVNVQQNAPTQELMHVYRQVVPQMNQQVIRTQMPVSQQNNIQSMQNVGQQTVANIGQTLATNVRPVSNVGINTQSNIGLKLNNVRPNTTQIVPNSTPMNQINRTSSPIVTATVNNVGTNNQQIRHIIQAQNVNIVPQSHPQIVPNSLPAVQSYATSVGTLNTVTYSAVRNGQPYTYRAIQPKPHANNIRVNFKPRANQMNVVRRPVAPNAINTPNINQSIPVSSMATPTSTNYIRMETDSPTFSKKRKSESPDEIHKKVANFGSITVTAQVKDKIKAKYANTSEIGVNTSPVHKMHKVSHNKVENQLPLLQINPMDAKIKQELLSPTAVPANPTPGVHNAGNILIKTEAGVEIKDKKDSKDVSQQTEEKLVRKTVFPQAKSTGRLLDAKAGLDMPKIDEPTHNVNIINNEIIQGPRLNDESKNIVNSNVVSNGIQQIPQPNYKQNTFNDKIKLEETKVEKNTSTIENLDKTIPYASTEMQKPISAQNINIPKPNDIKIELNPAVVLERNKEVKPSVQTKEEFISVPTATKDNIRLNVDKANIIQEKESKQAKLESKKPIEIPKTESPVAKIATESDFEQEIKDNKIEKKEYKNISINEMKGKELHIVDGNIHREERDFVLTHVLDGFVIQESNVPFAIRRPLKEKTVNAYVEDKNDPCIKAAKEEIRGHILELSQLHLNESKEKERLETESRLKENEAEETKKEDEPVTPETTVEEAVEENDIAKDNPFECLKQSIVKSWTVNDLAAHLAKYNWNETVSTLQEHEIDGESLFLVTKTQLVSIGLNEAHADVICDFVGSKN